MCWYYFTNLFTVSVCLPVHAVTRTHTHTLNTQHTHTQATLTQKNTHTSHTKNTGKYMSINTFTKAQYLSTQPRETRTLTEAMKARQTHRVPGPTTGCSPNKTACIEDNELTAVRYQEKKKYKYMHTRTHKSESESELRQPAVKYTQKIKQTNTRTCVSVYVFVYAERG